MWAPGHYASVAADLIPTLGKVLVDASGTAAGDHVLDVAAGGQTRQQKVRVDCFADASAFLG